MPTAQLTSAATIRLESLMRRSFSILLLATSIEVVANAVSQSSLLNNFSWVLLGLLLFGQILLVVSSWFGRARNFWFVGYGFLSLALLALWPLCVIDPAAMPAEFQPWLWWAIGSSAISVAIGAMPFVALLYLTANAVLWFIIDSSAFGGSSLPLLTLQDSIYIFLFTGAVAGLIYLIRDSAKSADDANTEAITSTLEQAKTDAVERERQRIDALVHDKVLSTLLLAISAHTPADRKNVSAQAAEAIAVLTATSQGIDNNIGYTPLGLFRALRRAAQRLVPEIEVVMLSGGTDLIPSGVAQSITEATLQAIDNARRHSQATAMKIVLDSPKPNHLEIQIVDNGLGFRLDRVSRDRIGIRISIYGRLESVGGSAQIESILGQGSTVKLRWPA